MDGQNVQMQTTELIETVEVPQPQPADPKEIYLVGRCLMDNGELQTTLKSMAFEPILVDETFLSLNLKNSDSNNESRSIYIFYEFSGTFFEVLRKRAQNNPNISIYGAPAILSCYELQTGLIPSPSGYPVYSSFLRNHTFSVTGMRSKEKVLDIRRKILYMGGLFVEKSVKVQFLIVEKVGGERYLDGCAIAVPILKPDWIEHLWNQRHNHRLQWHSELETWKCKTFYSLKVAFEGFDDELMTKLIGHVTSRDGLVVEAHDAQATHIVVKTESEWTSGKPKELSADGIESTETRIVEPIDLQSPTKRGRFDTPVCAENTPPSFASGIRHVNRDKVKVVKEEWFWTTLQVGYCTPEERFLIPTSTSEDSGNASIGTPTGLMSPAYIQLSDTDGGTPGSAKRKRRRNKDFSRSEFLSSLNLPDLPPKILSEISESGTAAVNLGGNSLGVGTKECVSDAEFVNVLKQISDFLATSDVKSMSCRQTEFAHLIETERNYVAILVNIVKNFKEPCEDENQPGGAILEPLEIKTIFHPILPIYSLHRKLLRDLAQLLIPWSEDNLIGKVYCDYGNGFRRAYEPFVNFFETIKTEIKRCEEKDGRFMAFLKIAQSRPDCGKQSLADLMIRPIQRLPSTALILSTLLKRTKDPNPDHEWMLKAVEVIDCVNKSINEGKRVTEARIAMFDIYNEIEGCPVDIISAQRSLQFRIDVHSLTGSEQWGPNTELSLLVFNDSILIAKRRCAAATKNLTSIASVANIRSPSLCRKSILPGQFTQHMHGPKPYKYLDIIYHVSIVKVIQVRDVECFALSVRGNTMRVVVFSLPQDPNWPKVKLILELAKLAALAIDRLDYEIRLLEEDYSQLGVPVSIQPTAFEIASKFANKARHKVTRALSLNRTPSKLKRTVSQMLSPFSLNKAQHDTSSVSQSSIGPTTPLRCDNSTRSLFSFGTRRGSGTPKSRKTLSERDRESKSALGNGNITCIEEA